MVHRLQQDDDEEEPPECAVCTAALPGSQSSCPSCSHVFCRACIAEVVRRSSSSSLIEPEAHVAEPQPRCPLCRHPILAPAAAGTPSVTHWLAQAPVEATLERRLSEKFPLTWQRRQAEAMLRAASSITVCIGNRIAPRARRADPDEVRWTLFVEVVAPPGWAERPPRKESRAAAESLSDGSRAAPGIPDGASTSSASQQSAANAAVTGMLVQCVRVILPEDQLPDGGAGGSEGCGGYAEIEDAPYELRGLASRSMGEFTAPVVVFWQRRLKLPPLSVEHRLSFQPDGTSTTHEVVLPNGLTLSRVLDRTRPKAIIGVGTASETRVY